MIKLKRKPAGRHRPNSPVTTTNNRPNSFMSYRTVSSSAAYQQSNRASDPGRNERNVKVASRLGRITHNLPIKLAVLAIIISLLYLTILDTAVNLTVQTTSSQNSLWRSRDTYQAAAESLLKGSVFNRSKLTINVSKFESKMLKQFPEIASLSLTLPLAGHQPVIHLVSKRPVLKLVTSRGSYLVDKQGAAIIKTTDAVGIDDLNIPTVVDESQLDLASGDNGLTAPMTSYIVNLSSYLVAKNVAISTLTLPANTDELRVKISDMPYYVRFGLSNDAAQSAGEYLALTEKLKASNVTPGEYIDLRVPERSFYK